MIVSRIKHPFVLAALAALAALALSVAAPAKAAPSQTARAQTTSAQAAAAQAAAALDDAPAGAPRPALWRVADADTEIFLFGSIHMLRPGDAWLFPGLQEALAGAKAVYFETGPDAAADPEAARLVARLGKGGRLAKGLSPEGRARLARVSARLGAPAALEGMRPWLACLALAAADAAARGADPALGADAALQRLARRAGTEIRAFETPAEQIRLFAGLSAADQRRMLEASLETYERAPDQLERMIAAWKEGDLPALEAITRDSLTRGPAALKQRLLTDRNAAWAQALAGVLEREPGRFVVVVGAGHLLGEESVQALLAREGYAVRRR